MQSQPKRHKDKVQVQVQQQCLIVSLSFRKDYVSFKKKRTIKGK